MSECACISQEKLNEIFPPDKANDFFDALYGGAEDGAYDIVLTCQQCSKNKIMLKFELRKRPGKCLKCSLTYGLPDVFRRHPLLDIAGTASKIAQELGWGNDFQWELFPVEEISNDLHIIPFEIEKI